MPVSAWATGVALIGGAPSQRGGSLAEVGDAWPGWGTVLETLTLRGGANTNWVIGGTTLLGLAGVGHGGAKPFGFASCERKVVLFRGLITIVVSESIYQPYLNL